MGGGTLQTLSGTPRFQAFSWSSLYRLEESLLSLTALLIVFAAVIGSSAMMGIIAYLLHRIRQLEGRTLGEAGPDRISARLVEMQEDLQAVQDQMVSLSERLDFTEKLLTKGDDTPPSPE